jgi:hypothetical protein
MTWKSLRKPVESFPRFTACPLGIGDQKSSLLAYTGKRMAERVKQSCGTVIHPSTHLGQGPGKQGPKVACDVIARVGPSSQV